MPTTLRTERLELDAPRGEDLDGYLALVAVRDPSRTPAHRRPPQLTSDDVAQSIARQRRALTEDGIGLYAVRESGRFVGYCGLVVGRASLDEPEIAVELAPDARGRGVATEAGSAVLAAVGATGRQRVRASVRAWNAASFRVLAKLGFTDDGEREADDGFGELLWWSRRLGRQGAGAGE